MAAIIPISISPTIVPIPRSPAGSPRSASPGRESRNFVKFLVINPFLIFFIKSFAKEKTYLDPVIFSYTFDLFFCSLIFRTDFSIGKKSSKKRGNFLLFGTMSFSRFSREGKWGRESVRAARGPRKICLIEMWLTAYALKDNLWKFNSFFKEVWK